MTSCNSCGRLTTWSFTRAANGDVIALCSDHALYPRGRLVPPSPERGRRGEDGKVYPELRWDDKKGWTPLIKPDTIL